MRKESKSEADKARGRSFSLGPQHVKMLDYIIDSCRFKTQAECVQSLLAQTAQKLRDGKVKPGQVNPAFVDREEWESDRRVGQIHR